MRWYPWLREIHVTCVVLTACGFVLRAWWMLRGSPLLEQQLTRILPHVVDAVLLISALGLTFLVDQYPFFDAWLTAKFFALIVYVLAGTIALYRGKTRRIRLVALAAACASFTYIVSVAVTRSPWPPLALPG